MHAKGTVLGPHARTPAPTARGQRTPTARLEDGQPGEDEHLTSDAPRNGARHPPRGSPPATTTARNARSQERTLWGRCWAPHAHTTRAPGKRAAGPGRPPPGTGGWERDSARHQAPPTTAEGHPPRDGLPQPSRHATPSQGLQAKGTVLDLHARVPTPTASGQRAPTARPDGGQPGEDERLTSDAPHNGARHPRRGSPPAAPTGRNAGSQERTLCSWCWVPHGLTIRAPDTWATGPGCPPPGTGGRESSGARRQTPSTTAEGHPWGQPPATAPAACSPPQGIHTKGTVQGPHAGSRGRASARPRTPPATAHSAPCCEAPPCHPHGTQRQLARAHEVGPVRGPPY